MRTFVKIGILWLVFSGKTVFAELIQGIYLTQSSVENTQKFERFVRLAEESGVNSFVADLERPTRKYQENIALLKERNILYIARIVMFPLGGQPTHIQSQQYWQKRYKLVEAALAYGADEIQLDYIRYSSKQPSSPKNAQDIHKVISWFKQQLRASNTPLQIDVFGEVTLAPSMHIGQDLKLFADSIDTACPMTYPSHYEPFQEHARNPYATVDTSLKALSAQFAGKIPFKVIPYIELFNYRYPMGQNQRHAYIKAQIKAIVDNKADGWYAWSAGNKYDYLFQMLKIEKAQKAKATAAQVAIDKAVAEKTDNNALSLDADSEAVPPKI